MKKILTESNIKKLQEEFSKVKGKKVLPYIPSDADLTAYLQLYSDLAID